MPTNDLLPMESLNFFKEVVKFHDLCHIILHQTTEDVGKEKLQATGEE